MITYTDKTLMPFGKYKGTALGNVPASTLLWYYDNIADLNPALKRYIEANKDVLEVEAKRSNRFNSR